VKVLHRRRYGDVEVRVIEGGEVQVETPEGTYKMRSDLIILVRKDEKIEVIYGGGESA